MCAKMLNYKRPQAVLIKSTTHLLMAVNSNLHFYDRTAAVPLKKGMVLGKLPVPGRPTIWM